MGKDDLSELMYDVSQVATGEDPIDVWLESTTQAAKIGSTKAHSEAFGARAVVRCKHKNAEAFLRVP